MFTAYLLVLYFPEESFFVVSLHELYLMWHLIKGDCRLVHGMLLMDHLDDVRKGNGESTIEGILLFLLCILEMISLAWQLLLESRILI